MSQNLALETEIGRLPELDQHLVRDCAHQMQLLLARYNNPHLESLATELVSAQLQESLKY